MRILTLICCLWLVAIYNLPAQKHKMYLTLGKWHYAQLEFDQANMLFQKAASYRKTAGEAHFFLGRMASLGEGQAINHRKAVKHFKQGVAANFALNHYGLALAYQYGEGVPLLPDSAKYHYAHIPLSDPIFQNTKETFYQLFKAIRLYYGHGVNAHKIEAIAQFRHLWNAGNLHAGIYLATYHYQGENGLSQADSAVYYWQILAQHRHAPSLRNLANCYLFGIGTNVDTALAASYLHQLYSHHHDSAAGLQAATLWLKNLNRQAEAIRLIEQLATDGYGPAALQLGDLYFNGSLMKRNYTQALKWYEAAAKAFQPQAIYMLATMYEAGQGVATDYTRALALYRQAGYLGYTPAMYQAGYMCEMGKGTEKDYCEAVMWYEKAAKSNHAQAIFRLALFKMNDNHCTNRDIDYAIQLLEQAAGLREPSAALNLALIYLNGVGIPADLMQAKFWLEESVRLSPGNPTALYHLGKILLENKSLKTNTTEAIRYLEQAGELGNPEAYTYLAQAFETGRFVPKNYATAYQYLHKMPATFLVESSKARLLETGDKHLPRNVEKAFIHYFQAFALAERAEDEQNMKQHLIRLKKQVNARGVKILAEKNSEHGGLGLSPSEADELMLLLKKHGLI